MFATVAGIVLFLLAVGVIGAMSIVGMVASTSATISIPNNTVLVINLSGNLTERAESNVVRELTGKVSADIGLDDILNAIEKAKTNDNIKGIYIESSTNLFTSDSPASSAALRKALENFKKSGKWIVAYGDLFTQSNYYISSVADKIWLNPSGIIDWHGLAAEPMFLKDVMAKLGVKMQLAKVGSYKSAPETYTADKMSDENREQITAYITGIWNNMTADVAKSRKISVATLNQLADHLIAFDDPQNYVKSKMVDKLMYTDEVKNEIKKLLKLSSKEDISQVSVAQMQQVKREPNKGDEIAVYYAYGNIVDHEVENFAMGGGHLIVGNKVAKDLQRLADNDDVKAVVIRVNSGGGSAYASEQIWRAVSLLKAKKPVVVSMGGMAASGGYYMSCAANWIVAEPTTLTGSIGIFGMFPDFSGLLTQKLGVKFDVVETNKHSNFGTQSRPFTNEEMSFISNYIDRGYNLFRKRVADGRKQQVVDIEKVAQGHVWLGQDALKIKLVDQLGGLPEAVKKAAELANLKEYFTYAYPEKASWQEQLMSTAIGGNGNYLGAQLHEVLGTYYDPFMLMRTINRQNAVQARIPFELNIR